MESYAPYNFKFGSILAPGDPWEVLYWTRVLNMGYRSITTHFWAQVLSTPAYQHQSLLSRQTTHPKQQIW